MVRPRVWYRLVCILSELIAYYCSDCGGGYGGCDGCGGMYVKNEGHSHIKKKPSLSEGPPLVQPFVL